MSNPWTAAWEEAEATAPPGIREYDTLELQHVSFVDESNQPYAIRVVTDVASDTDFTLEPGATLNGGETVTFTAVTFFADRPQFSEGQTPQCTVTIDNVARYLVPVLDNAVQVKADLKCIFRQYRSDDLSEPAYGPVEFVIKKVTMSGTQIQGVAQLDDLANKKFPTRIYTISEFPALQP